ncbi:MAG: HPr family phosphocarrier protein [Pseudomonadota bacterium]
MIETEIEIVNRLGLHARAAAKLVSVASRFESSIQIARAGRTANAKSIMGVMMLAAACGTTVDLQFDGADEDEAHAALRELIENRFGEPE